MESYFIISNSDGDTTIEQVAREVLLQRLTPDKNGDLYYGNGKFLKSIDDSDTNYWGSDMLIIKGEIAVPMPKEVIKNYTI